MRIIPIMLAALFLNTGALLADSGDAYLECKYGGLKSFYKTPKLFKISQDGYVYDGPVKMKLNRESVVDSYLFGAIFDDGKILMHNIDIFNGSWSQYTMTRDDVARIKNEEEVTKNKINSYAGLGWKHVGECRSVEK